MEATEFSIQNSLLRKLEEAELDLQNRVYNQGWFICWDCREKKTPSDMRIRTNNKLPTTPLSQLCKEVYMVGEATTFEIVAICLDCYLKEH